MAINLKQKAPVSAAAATSADGKSFFQSLGGLTFTFGKPVKSKEIIFFYSQISLMLEIGTALTAALKAAGAQTNNPKLKEIIIALLLDIEEGRQLSDAMQRHPKVFSSIIVSMVKAGETGGFLNKTLDRIVEMLEKRQAFIAQLKSTLTYPIILCVLGFGVVLFIVIGLLPKFSVLFEGKESLLPFTTRFLIALSDSIREYWWGYITGAVALIVGAKVFKDSNRGRALIERFLISVPPISKITNKAYTLQLLRTLGNLLESQVPLLEALEVTRTTFSNRYFRHFIDKIRDHVEGGGKFSQPFADYPYVLASAKQMVATGEEAGNLPAVMLRMAKFYDTEVERELKAVSALIEPAALIVLGAVVGMIVASVILPMFKIASTMH